MYDYLGGEHDDARTLSPDPRLDAPAFHGNHEVIRDALIRVLDRARPSENVLEVGSGTGQHIVEFARAWGYLNWWPSDPEPMHRLSIDAWRAGAGLENLRAARDLNIASDQWGLGVRDSFAAIVAINVLHIAPWSVSIGLMRGASRHLSLGGRLVVYGPFRRDGRHTADSNVRFDAYLRGENPDWGVRDTADLADAAAEQGLDCEQIIDMPRDNAILVYGRR
jgi:SAM-dependent methyltransferase